MMVGQARSHRRTGSRAEKRGREAPSKSSGRMDTECGKGSPPLLRRRCRSSSSSRKGIKRITDVILCRPDLSSHHNRVRHRSSRQVQHCSSKMACLFMNSSCCSASSSLHGLLISNIKVEARGIEGRSRARRRIQRRETRFSRRLGHL